MRPGSSDDLPSRFNPIVFIVASLAAAVILVSIVAVPQWLSKQARWEVVRSHVGAIGQLAASVVDGESHRQLLDSAYYTKERYDRATRPLVRFHSANPDLFYVYTMAVQNGVPHFILDTAASPSLRTRHRLRASAYMEPFHLRQEYQDGWLDKIASGRIYVTPTYEHDDYGYFLSAHAPIYDSQGHYSGFVGVDFDMGYYLAEEARFRTIEAGSVAVAILSSLLIGFLVALYYGDLQRRLRQLYYGATRDDLTRLLNRRAAKAELSRFKANDGAHYAMLLVDIDHLKMIIALYGHSAADAVIVRTAEAIRRSVGKDDICARLGEGEFMVFCPHGDEDNAGTLAKRISYQLSNQEMAISNVKPEVTIGIAVQDATKTGFSQMYQKAYAALYRARVEGKTKIGMPVATKPDAKRPGFATTHFDVVSQRTAK